MGQLVLVSNIIDYKSYLRKINGNIKKNVDNNVFLWLERISCSTILYIIVIFVGNNH